MKEAISSVLCFSLAIFSFYSCGGVVGNDKIAINNSVEFAVGIDTVWDATLYVVSNELNFRVQKIDRNSWLIQSDTVGIHTLFIDYYTTVGGAQFDGGRFFYTLRLTNVKAKTNLNMITYFEGDRIPQIYIRWGGTEVLYSNGEYENFVFGRIKERLRKLGFLN